MKSSRILFTLDIYILWKNFIFITSLKKSTLFEKGLIWGGEHLSDSNCNLQSKPLQ